MILNTINILICPDKLRLLNDVNTPSAHGLENSKACNKYQANSATEVNSSRRPK